jgi:uncharacterized lipoprotein YddW (UPF0748 family)
MKLKSNQLFRFITTILIVLSVQYCATTQPVESVTPKSKPLPADFQEPMVQREFRAAWVATVANIDWPSKPGLSTEDQQAEALAILDTAAAVGLNALIFQVRPQCDALYKTALEPWSYYLTGAQGQAPDPYYDPLEFWVEEAHKRGIELHAWFNPYRAHHPAGDSIMDYSLATSMPEMVRELPNGYYWLDPSMPEVQDHSYNVVMDVVQRYDIDGVHFDDYFYPYGDGSFPDDESWAAYQRDGGKLSREDWRRDHVNVFIKRVYDGIKAEKPHVKFGLSPFGIWRPGNPPSIRGFDQYNMLYADARLWLNQGWVDYWTPQLYWQTRQIPQSFPVLLGWWDNENHHHRNLWPGLFTSRIKDETGALENFSQIMIARGIVENGPGHVHFSIKAIMQNYGGIRDELQTPYREPALVPPSPWLDAEAPRQPVFDTALDSSIITLLWDHPEPSDVFRWVVGVQRGNDWQIRILNREDRSLQIPAVITPTNKDGEPGTPRAVTAVFVSAVDRTGNESTRVMQKITVPSL